MSQRIFHGQNAAPAVPEQAEVVLVAADRLPNLIDLGDEARDGPEVVVVRLVTESRAELVVIIIFDALLRQEAVEGFEIFVGRARAAVEQEELQMRIVSDPLYPDVEI